MPRAVCNAWALAPFLTAPAAPVEHCRRWEGKHVLSAAAATLLLDLAVAAGKGGGAVALAQHTQHGLSQARRAHNLRAQGRERKALARRGKLGAALDAPAASS